MRRTLRHTSKRSPLVFGLLAVLLVAALSVPAARIRDYGDPSRRGRTQFASFRRGPRATSCRRHPVRHSLLRQRQRRPRAGGHRRRRHARQRACRVHGGAAARAYGPRKAASSSSPKRTSWRLRRRPAPAPIRAISIALFPRAARTSPAHRWRRVSGRWSSVSGPTTSLTSMKGTTFTRSTKTRWGNPSSTTPCRALPRWPKPCKPL